MKILLVEDERDLSDTIKKVLELNHYDVDQAFDGEEALDYISYTEYDGIIMDVMMPIMDGYTCVKKIRERGIQTPIIMLTAKAEIDDKVFGLDVGADDYLTKPFVIKELLARVRALTRRKGDIATDYTIGNVKLNPNTFELSTDKATARLTSKEYKLMEYLMRNQGVVLSTEKIMEKVWEYDTEAEINVVWVFISAIRKKLESIGANCQIKAMRGIGYRLEVND